MRLKNKPWAHDLVDAHPEKILVRPEGEIDWQARFENPALPIRIEVGSGKGQFIIEQAKAHPDYNFVAIELQTSAAGVILRDELELNLPNLQILLGDGKMVDTYFKPESVDLVYLNFSDPWPKTRHEKRRLTYKDFLASYENILTDSGHMEFKTDNRGLFEYSLVSMNNYDMRFDYVSLDLHNTDDEVYANNIQTEYEEKFSKKGHPIYALHAHFGAKK